MKPLFYFEQKSKAYFVSVLVILSAIIFFVIAKGFNYGTIALNGYHPFLLNVFFINVTFIGDAEFAFILSAFYIFYFKKKDKGLALLFSTLITCVIIQIIKNLIISKTPVLFFEDGQYLFYNNNQGPVNIYGFPSSHTAIAFALATVFAMNTTDKSKQLLFLIFAIMIGFSRMYLAQQFLIDTVIGATIGSIAGIVAYNLSYINNPIKRFTKRVNNNYENANANTIAVV